MEGKKISTKMNKKVLYYINELNKSNCNSGCSQGDGELVFFFDFPNKIAEEDIWYKGSSNSGRVFLWVPNLRCGESFE